MVKMKVSLKKKRHYVKWVDSHMREFERELVESCKNAAELALSSFLDAHSPDYNHIKKAQSSDNSATLLLVPRLRDRLEGWFLEEIDSHRRGDRSSLIREFLGPLFSFGMALSKKDDSSILTPPTEEESRTISSTPRAVDVEAMSFLEAYAFNEISSKDSDTFSLLTHHLIESLERRGNPLGAAKKLARDLDNDVVGWSRVARTESARAIAHGSFAESRRLGVDVVYVPDSPRACDACQQLVVGRVFRIKDIIGKSNRGRKRADWIPALPVHPNCTCTSVPASDWLVEQAGGIENIGPQGVKVEWVPPHKRDSK